MRHHVPRIPDCDLQLTQGVMLDMLLEAIDKQLLLHVMCGQMR